MGELANKLTHNDMPCIDDEAIRYFRDVLDRIRRVETTVGVLREVHTSVFEASNLLEQQRTGASTRQLAAWAAILAVPTAIAGADRRDLPGALPPVGRRDRRRPQPGAPPPTITLSWNRSPVIRAHPQTTACRCARRKISQTSTCRVSSAWWRSFDNATDAGGSTVVRSPVFGRLFDLGGTNARRSAEVNRSFLPCARRIARNVRVDRRCFPRPPLCGGADRNEHDGRKYQREHLFHGEPRFRVGLRIFSSCSISKQYANDPGEKA